MIANFKVVQVLCAHLLSKHPGETHGTLLIIDSELNPVNMYMVF